MKLLGAILSTAAFEPGHRRNRYRAPLDLKRLDARMTVEIGKEYRADAWGAGELWAGDPRDRSASNYRKAIYCVIAGYERRKNCARSPPGEKRGGAPAIRAG